MRVFIRCLYKDRLEFIRTRRSGIAFAILLSIALAFLGASYALPKFFENIADERLPAFFDNYSLGTLIENSFPQELSKNLGVFSSDIYIFYSVFVLFSTSALIPSEIHAGKWILPLQSGISRRQLMLSKVLMYAAGFSVPCFAIYNLYYVIGSMFLIPDFPYIPALVCAFILAFGVFALTCISFFCSLLIKQNIINFISIFSCMVLLPDLLYSLHIGHFFPTYILTFLYNSSTAYNELVIPVTEILFLMILLYFCSIKALSTADFSAREHQ